MKKLIIWILAILGIIFLLLIGTIIAGIYYLKDIDRIKVEKFEVTGIKSLSKSSLKINGDIYLNNPSKISIPIKSLKFKIYLNETGKEISSGQTPSFKVDPQKINKIPLEYELKFDETINLLPKLLLKNKVPAIVKINLIIDYPIIRNRMIPFEFEIDIKEYLKNYINDQIPIPVLNQIPEEIPTIN